MYILRRKGENVATSEIEQVIAPLAADVAVYGVKIPHQDGRAGMAAIVLRDTDKENIDNWLKLLAVEVKTHLPAYARPLFIRLDKELLTTGTFKVMIIIPLLFLMYVSIYNTNYIWIY